MTKETENLKEILEEVLEFNYRKPKHKRSTWVDFNRGSDELHQEWLRTQAELRIEGAALWKATGFHNDVRIGWEKAKKEKNLGGNGIYDVPLEIIESIEDARKRTLELAGVTYYDRKSMLEKELEEKEAIIESLLETIAELKARKSQKKSESRRM